MPIDHQQKIFVAGHTGLSGSAILRKLVSAGFQNVITRPHRELDLTVQSSVEQFFERQKPDVVFLAAGRVGGIQAIITHPAEFIHINLLIQSNVIDAAYRHGTKRLIFLGSSCIYPKFAPQPLKEEYLLTSPLEPTNESYAVAKIAGIKMCEAYRRQYNFDSICVMPTNLYGPHDNFDLESSHVLPALMRKFHEARLTENEIVKVWGTGFPKREFMHVDDLAEACVFLMQQSRENIEAATSGDYIVNIGTGEDLTIREMAELIAQTVNFQGQLEFDGSKPDGTPRKLLDVSRLKQLGWKARISLEEGLRQTYQWFSAAYTQGDFKGHPAGKQLIQNQS